MLSSEKIGKFFEKKIMESFNQCSIKGTGVIIRTFIENLWPKLLEQVNLWSDTGDKFHPRPFDVYFWRIQRPKSFMAYRSLKFVCVKCITCISPLNTKTPNGRDTKKRCPQPFYLKMSNYRWRRKCFQLLIIKENHQYKLISCRFVLLK